MAAIRRSDSISWGGQRRTCACNDVAPMSDMRPRSRGADGARAVVRKPPPSEKQRAQGKPGARCTRSLACKINKAHEHSHHRFTGVTGLPCAMVYGLFRALPGDRALLPPSLRWLKRNLTPASGCQDHTALPSALSVARLTTPKRPPHPAPNVRDDRETSLLVRQDGTTVRLIWGLRQCQAHATD